MPPLKPMLAKALAELPDNDSGSLLYEPKWDGFRCIVYRDGDEIQLGSRNTKPLDRYFPEVIKGLLANLPERCVLDGELVIAGPDGLDFNALQQRIHPADSRVQRLASETPAGYVAFDLLALDDLSLLDVPFAQRRHTLEQLLQDVQPPVYLTPSTSETATAADWFVRFEGAGLDGVMAKPAADPYVPDKRVQFKIKHKRTADCVVAAFRWHKDGQGVGSLLLGLYDDSGNLHHMGVASSFTAARRSELVAELGPLTEVELGEHPWAGWAAQSEAATSGGRMPGAPSRWNATKDLSFVPLRPELVAEVTYERVDSGRFRHSARLLHWRPDRDPASCTFEQLEVVPPIELQSVFNTVSSESGSANAGGG